MPESYSQDVTSRKDYSWDFDAWLPSTDTISTFEVTAEPAGLTIEDKAINAAGRKLTAFLSGGTAGTTYMVKGYIETAEGRKEPRFITLTITGG
jgi:hypothetical protein